MRSTTDERQRTYRVQLAGWDDKIEFVAEDVSGALQRCQAILPYGALASLFEDEIALGRISYSGDGLWSVQEPARTQDG